MWGFKKRKQRLDVLAYGFPLNGNFGGPSVAHGLRDALARLYPGHRLTIYQPWKVDPKAAADLGVPVKFFPYDRRAGAFWRDWLRTRILGLPKKDEAVAEFWRDFNRSNCVINIYAICFCSTIRDWLCASGRKAAIKTFLRHFSVGLAARLSGKLSIKGTSSFGPINRKGDRLLAWLASHLGFVRAVAREEIGRVAMLKEARMNSKAICAAPDLANAWECAQKPSFQPRFGFSVSFQSVVQWKKIGADYLPFMRDLVIHAARYGCEIVLIPNQYSGEEKGDSDIAIAEEIARTLPRNVSVRIFDVRNSSSTELKNEIAGCAALVACRYHACVAAFSSCVPTLVLGWHVKYDELARHYGQSRWIIGTEQGTKLDVKARMDELWAKRELVQDEIATRRDRVICDTINSVRFLFGEDWFVEETNNA